MFRPPMMLADYLNSLPVADRADYAKRCGTSPDYLSQVAAGTRTPKLRLAVRISKESAGVVRVRPLLRLDEVDWLYLRQEILESVPA